MGEPFTTKTYYKVVQLHAVVFVICFVFASLGCGFTQNRVILDVNKTAIEEGEGEQKTVPYWASGYILGSANFLLFLLSLNVNRLVTKGIYTAARKKVAKDRDGLYRLLMFPATIWGVGGAVFTGIFGVCDHDGDETCYYVYTNFDVNKGFAITQIVIHILWFFIAMDLCKSTKGVEVQIGSIAVNTNLDSSPAVSTTTVTSPAQQTNNGSAGAAAPPPASAATAQAPDVPPKTPSYDTDAPPPSYDEVMSTPYMITYPTAPPYVADPNAQPQHLYSGSAFPDAMPTVTHAQQ